MTDSEGNVQLGQRRHVLVAVIVAALVIVGAGMAVKLLSQGDADQARVTPTSQPVPQTTITRPSPTTTATATTPGFATRTSPPTPEDEALAARFLELAASPDRDSVEALPLASRVALGLGNQHIDLYVTATGEVAAVTLDFWEPGCSPVLVPDQLLERGLVADRIEVGVVLGGGPELL